LGDKQGLPQHKPTHKHNTTINIILSAAVEKIVEIVAVGV
jgi:hypothetical protein